MNSVAFMEKKAAKTPARRRLSAEEAAACARFSELLTRSRFSQETLAPEIGVTAGAVGHWARGVVAIPLRRAAAVAKAVGGAPEEICVEWRDYVAPHLPLGSQSMRLDPHKVAATTQALNIVLSRRSGTAKLDLEDEIDAELFSEAYAEHEALEGTPGANVAMGGAVSELLDRREERRNAARRAGEQAGRLDRGKDRKAGAG